MKIFKKKSELLSWRQAILDEGLEVGFVPTMGALHPGHLSLIGLAASQNEVVASSIFVNPLQFNNPRDLQTYPRNLDQDFSMLASAGCHAVFCPDQQEMYPVPPRELYDFGLLEQVMEGRYRPGHFNGVAIVVKELFLLVKPQRAYFGQKDFQQLQVIRELVRRESLPVEIVAGPTIREADGLAMSSRNQKLSPGQRARAPQIYQALLEARQNFGKIPLQQVKDQVAHHIAAHGMQLEYFEIVAADTLLPVHPDRPPGQKVVGCIAAYLGEVRLIDNLFFN